MPRLSVNKLVPGMRLAKPVINTGGMVMLGEDTELTTSLIERIGNMEVEAVYVQGMSQQPISKDQALAELDKRFRKVSDEPIMGLIKGLMKKHIEGLYE